jgi:hypothetical protein
MDKPVVYVCSSPADKDWTEKFLQSLRPTLGGIAVAAANGAEGNGASTEQASYRDALERSPLAILLTSPDFVSQFGDDGQAASSELMSLLKDREEHGLTRVYRLAVKPSAVDDTWLGKYPRLLEPDQPLSALSEHEGLERILQACRTIRDTAFPKAPKLQTLGRIGGSPSKAAETGPEVVETDRWMPTTGEPFVGRRAELAQLDGAWTAPPPVRIVGIVGYAGSGKTALVNQWLKRLKKEGYKGARRVLAWSFTDPNGGEPEAFFRTALARFGQDLTRCPPHEYGERLAAAVCAAKTLIVLDGLEAVQQPAAGQTGWLRTDGAAKGVRDLLLSLQHLAHAPPAGNGPSLCVVTSREPIKDLAERRDDTYQEVPLGELGPAEGVSLLKELRVQGTDDDLRQAVAELRGHALSLAVLGNELRAAHFGDVRRRDRVNLADTKPEWGSRVRRAMEAYDDWFAHSPDLAVLRVLSLFAGPTERGLLEDFVREERIEDITDGIDHPDDWQRAVSRLQERGLVFEAPGSGWPYYPGPALDTLPIVRQHLAEQMRRRFTQSWARAHERLLGRLRPLVRKTAETLADLRPALLAVYHGCAAGAYQEAAEVYFLRVRQGRHDRAKQLGAVREELATLGCFFARQWDRTVAELRDDFQADILQLAGDRLKDLGRSEESHQAYLAAMDRYTETGNMERYQQVKGKLHGA